MYCKNTKLCDCCNLKLMKRNELIFFFLDKNICEQTLERKKYLGRVAKKSTTHSTTVEDKNHLFQALLLIGLDLSSNKEKLPYIKYKYPVKVIVLITFNLK